MNPVFLDFTIIPKPITEFCETMNTIFNVILHPIQSIQSIATPTCLAITGVFILCGIVGARKCYTYAAVTIIIYMLIMVL